MVQLRWQKVGILNLKATRKHIDKARGYEGEKGRVLAHLQETYDINGQICGRDPSVTSSAIHGTSFLSTNSNKTVHGDAALR
jgi:hypothetical protein